LEKALKDGSKVLIREMHAEDEQKLLEFFRDLPLEERQYLRMDVTIRENLQRRMNPGPFRRIWRLVAEHEGRIIADATLYGASAGWMRHAAEIRWIVHPDFKRMGLGSILLWELFQKSLSEKYHLVFCEVVPAQTVAIKVLENLGFKQVMVRPNHIKDISGKKRDLHVYVLNIKELWNVLKDHFHKLDTAFGHV
jgi:RimJ/RimL family protein N-acetyltransferase